MKKIAVRSLSWPVAAVLVMVFVAPAVWGGTESEQADPNAPKDNIQSYQPEHLKKNASGEIVRDEEDNFIFIADPNAPARPVRPAAPRLTRPQQSPASILGLRRHAVDIGPEVYYFKYEEPGLMEDEGVFYGVRFGYTFREWTPSSPKESTSDGGAMFRAEGRLAFGQVDYDGQLSDGTPYTIDNIDDYVFEGRLLLGADMLRGDTFNTLYAGIGYRYLNDDPSFDPAGYERESNYLYVPLGYQFDSSRKAGWSFGFNAEFDFFIVGYQRSHLSDFSPAYDDVEDRQESGYGYRASVRFQHKSEDAIFVIEPFFRCWDIDDSEVTYDSLGGAGLEPANETTEVGIQLIWMF